MEKLGPVEALEQAIMKLVSTEPFYANLIQNMRREFTDKFPTLAVSVTDQVNLYINPHFFLNMSESERVAVLLHECLHVINNHFVRFRDLEPQIFDETKQRSILERIQDMQTASLNNQAADYAINEYIPNLPRKMKFFDKDGKAVKDEQGNIVEGKPCLVEYLQEQIPTAKKEMHMEYYHDLLKEDAKNNPQKGNGQGSPMVIDDHSSWHEGDITEDEILEKVKGIVNKAVEQTGDKNIGNMPSHILQAIEALNHVPRDWRSDLQRFVARSSEILLESSRKKRNRRYGILYAGHIKNPKLHIGVALDTSGSVGDEELQQFFAEIVRMHNLNVEITILECDTQLNGVYEFNPKKKFEIHGRGGTSFKPVFDELPKHDLDALIYFTDGEVYEDSIKKPAIPVLWALTGRGEECLPFKWGKKLKIEVKKRVRR